MITIGGVLGGSTAVGIFATTFALRLVLIPVMLPLSVRTRERQKIARTIKPEIKEIHDRYKDDPGGMSRELKRVHQEAGIEVAADQLEREATLHSSFRSVGSLAQQLGIETLVLVRLRPPPVFDLQVTSLVSEQFDGAIVIADDGDELTP